jgi:hypothetical protein
MQSWKRTPGWNSDGTNPWERTMLDVHLPHEPIHGTRDFFLHLFTITIGLLIAIGLEAMVEAVHHRHQRISRYFVALR